MTATYVGEDLEWADSIAKKSDAGDAPGAFGSKNNKCLNSDITPAVDEYDYEIRVREKQPQRFVICAKLEPVGGWESIGNSKESADAYDSIVKNTESDPVNFDRSCPADYSGSDASCYFCVANQQ
jgi:hypothetical protein